MKTNFKRILALMLVLSMAVCTAPVAFAKESSSELTITDVTKSDCTAMTLGTTYTLKNKYNYYYFTPTEDGTYYVSTAGSSKVDSDVEIYEFDEDAITDESMLAWDSESGDVALYVELSADTTYCFVFCSDKSDVSYTASISKAVIPTDLSFKNLSSKMYVCDHSDYSKYLTSSTAKADLSDNAIEWSSSDENVIKFKSGKLVCNGVGTATITATSRLDDTVFVSREITVISPETIAVGSKKTVSFDSEIGNVKCYSFTPTETGKYEVLINGISTDIILCYVFKVEYNSDVDATITSSTASCVSSTYVYDADNSVYSLEKGKTYYISVAGSNASTTASLQIGKNNTIAETNVLGTYTTGRASGETRFDTAFKIANQMKKALGCSKFETVIVTTGLGFADALAASSLSEQFNAPILLVSNQDGSSAVVNYIKSNLATNGKVYILGGENAVSKSIRNDIAAIKIGGNKITVTRLQGDTRYETNLAILNEVKTHAKTCGETLLVCSGKNYPDGLSASALGLPILLVEDALTSAQISFLNTNKFQNIIVIGGTNAVSSSIETTLKKYASKGTMRIGGADRYETSYLIAKAFAGYYFSYSNVATFAAGKNFPDALTGGPIARVLHAPLLLTDSGSESYANQFAKTKTKFVVFGGTNALSDATVKTTIKR